MGEMRVAFVVFLLRFEHVQDAFFLHHSGMLGESPRGRQKEKDEK